MNDSIKRVEEFATLADKVIAQTAMRERLQVLDVAMISGDYSPIGKILPQPGPVDGWMFVHARSKIIDETLSAYFNEVISGMPQTAAILKTGGNGRGELFPDSDSDLRVLVPSWQTPALLQLQRAVQGFLDRSNILGHHVGAPYAVDVDYRLELSEYSALREMKMIAGDETLAASFREGITRTHDPVWYALATLGDITLKDAKYGKERPLFPFHIKGDWGGLRDFLFATHIKGIQTLDPSTEYYHQVPKQVLDAVGFLFEVRYWNGARHQNRPIKNGVELTQTDYRDLTRRFGPDVDEKLYKARWTIRNFRDAAIEELSANSFTVPDSDTVVFSNHSLSVTGIIDDGSVGNLLLNSQRYGIPISPAIKADISSEYRGVPLRALSYLLSETEAFSRSLKNIWEMGLAYRFFQGPDVQAAYQHLEKLETPKGTDPTISGRIASGYQSLRESSDLLAGLRLAIVVGSYEGPEIERMNVLKICQYKYSLPNEVAGFAEFLVKNGPLLQNAAHWNGAVDAIKGLASVVKSNKGHLDGLLLYAYATTDFGHANILHAYERASNHLQGQETDSEEQQQGPSTFEFSQYRNIIVNSMREIESVEKRNEPLVLLTDMGEQRLIRVIAKDRKRLLQDICGAMVPYASIEYGEIHTWESKGIAYDLFSVRMIGGKRDNDLIDAVYDVLQEKRSVKDIWGANCIKVQSASQMLEKSEEIKLDILDGMYRLHIRGAKDNPGIFYSIVHALTEHANADIISTSIFTKKNGGIVDNVIFKSPLAYATLYQTLSINLNLAIRTANGVHK